MKARLTKAEFHNAMERFVERYKKSEEWIEKFNDVFPGAFDYIYENNFSEIAIDFLKYIMHDTAEWIEYFIYEKNCKWFEYEVDGETIYVKSYDDLYDLIVGDEMNE